MLADQRESGIVPNDIARPFISSPTDYPEIQAAFAALLSDESPPRAIGSMYMPALGRAGSLLRILRPDLTILKCVAAQRMLPWITRSFSNQCVMIIRNPVSVIASSKAVIDAQTDWMKEPSSIESNAQLRTLFPALGGIEEEDVTVFDRLVVKTIVDTMLPLMFESCRERLYILPYETAARDPDVFVRLCIAMGLEGVIRKRTIVNRVSVTASPDSNLFRGADPNRSWQHRLTGSELSRIEELMERLSFPYYRVGTGPDIPAMRRRGIANIVE